MNILITKSFQEITFKVLLRTFEKLQIAKSFGFQYISPKTREWPGPYFLKMAV
jgi:hypothetical protein